MAIKQQDPKHKLECPYGTKYCEVAWQIYYRQWRCAMHGLLYLGTDDEVIAAL